MTFTISVFINDDRPTPSPNKPIPSWPEYEQLLESIHDYFDHATLWLDDGEPLATQCTSSPATSNSGMPPIHLATSGSISLISPPSEASKSVSWEVGATSAAQSTSSSAR